MKSIKILASALAMAALLFTSCKKEHYEGGIDVSKPGITDLTYGEFKHDSKSITLSWTADKAVAAGATSFSVQLSLDKDGHGVDMYDPSKGVTVAVESGKTDYTATLAGQSLADKYFVRVRANYPKSVYSAWTWVSDANGNPLVYKVGRGFIPEGIETPYVYKVTPTSNALIVKWDLVKGATKYIVEYRKSSDPDWTVLEFGPQDNNCKVRDLPSQTSYDVRAMCETPDGASAYTDVITVSTRQPGSYPKEMATADDFVAWLEGGVVEVDAADTYSLTADIDLTGMTFTAMDEPLMGTFDGQGHTVTGVSSTLFYQNEGTIKNLIAKGSVTATGAAISAAAFLVTNKGLVENVNSEISISHAIEADADIYIGGFVVRNEGTITGSVNGGDVTVTAAADHKSRAAVGGLAAVNSGVMTNCANNGNVTFKSSANVSCPAVAGVAAFCDGTLVETSNTGSVTLEAYNHNAYGEYYETMIGKTSSTAGGCTPAVAGIVAYSYAEDNTKAMLDGCVNDGNVTFKLSAIDKIGGTLQRTQCAGIIANPWGLVQNCINNGTLSCTAATTSGAAGGQTYIMCIGGIGGGDWFPGTPNQAATSYKNCVNNGDIKLENFDKAGSNSVAGGICGWPGVESKRDNVTSNCVNNGKVILNGTVKARIGGIHGGVGTIQGCTNNGEVIIESGAAASAAGGIAGFTSQGLKITNSVAAGKVFSYVACTGGVGGIVGNLGNSAGTGGFAGCSVACSVTNPEGENAHTGMLVGYFNGTSASTPIATPKVKGVINFSGKKIALTASNYTSYLVGTANASADNHPIESTFDSSEYVDPDGGGGEGEDEGKKLSAPTNVGVTILYNSVIVTWDPVEDAEWYVVEYKPKTADEWTGSERVDVCEYTITGLAHGTDYSFRVKAFASVSSSYSDVVDESTYEEVNLDTPVITDAVPSVTSVTLSWNPVDKAKGYFVQYKSASDEDYIDAGSCEASPFTVEGLKPDTMYAFRVKALGEGGNEGSYSKAKVARTDKVTYSYPLAISDATTLVNWLAAGAEFCSASDVITLESDIDLAGAAITPAASFAGTFNGQGKTIKNLTNALFASVDEGAVVKDVNVDGGSLINWTDEIPAETGIAFIAAKSNGSILNCNVAGKIQVKSGSAGKFYCAGVVALSPLGYVENCKFSGSVDVELTNNSASCSAISGVVGRAGDASKAGQTIIRNCENTGSIKFLFSGPSKGMLKFGIGGVLGQTPSVANAPNDHGTVEGCTNRGNLEWEYPAGGSGSYPAFGGVAGIIEGQIKSCYNHGTLTYKGSKEVAATDADFGGVAGYVTGNADDCHNYGTFTIDAAFAGGTANAQSGGNTDYSSFGGVFGGVGPFISVADNFTKYDNTIEKGVTVSNCTNEAALVLTTNMVQSGGPKMCFGGVAGACTANMVNCHNNASVSVKSNTRWIFAGGLAGLASGNVSDCTSKGDLAVDADKANHPASVAKQQDYIGGLLGMVAKGTTISNCHNSGNVSLVNLYTTPGTLSYLGGLTGSYSGSLRIENCSNSGTVTSDNEDPICLGGISGAFNGVMLNTTNSGDVVNASSYTSSTAGKETEVGGLAGYANATFTGCNQTGKVSSVASGSFVGGIAGGLGAADLTWAGCTVDCAIEGDATKACVLGRWRSAGTNILTLGEEGSPFTIKGASASLPLVGLDNGNSVSEANVIR
ncbi:MAG: fibronectin type III domain-containing protein [Bacteroidales bacterium]|nr:fibronectin type III domain-containing protein [Bacteroidales bacterium]